MTPPPDGIRHNLKGSAMDYGNTETTEDGPRAAASHVGMRNDVPRPMPAPFDPFAVVGDWPADDAQVDEWASLGTTSFEDATSSLTLQALRFGISQAQCVAEEHERRRSNALQLVGRLREVAHAAAEHGRDDVERPEPKLRSRDEERTTADY